MSSEEGRARRPATKRSRPEASSKRHFNSHAAGYDEDIPTSWLPTLGNAWIAFIVSDAVAFIAIGSLAVYQSGLFAAVDINKHGGGGSDTATTSTGRQLNARTGVIGLIAVAAAGEFPVYFTQHSIYGVIAVCVCSADGWYSW